MELQEQQLRSLFLAAVDAAAAARCVPAALPAWPTGRTIVVGAGKAAAAMAKVVEEHCPGHLHGLVITRYGHSVHCDRVKVIEAGHPVPDAAGYNAAKRILAMVKELSPEDLLLCLMSGGASALLSVPAPGISLQDKQLVTRALLSSGASIREINCVRKHLSAIKGGRLAAAAYPARIVTLIISDVPGDDAAIVGSGPTLPDPTTSREALAILERFAIEPPAAVATWLTSPESETPKGGAAAFLSGQDTIIAAARDSLAAAEQVAHGLGLFPIVLGDDLEGEARELGRSHAALAKSVLGMRLPPRVLISGGETSVTVRGAGRGGRNAEYLLGLAEGLNGVRGIWAIACDTDGIDGSENNAGGVIGPDVLARAAAANVSIADRLKNNDGYGFLEAVGGLVFTGPTRTNVNDFRAILIDG